MNTINVLLAGESWATSSTHYKGWDQFTVGSYETGADRFIEAIKGTAEYINIDFLPNHEALTQFPSTLEQLSQYQVTILSDIGSNTLLLHPDTFIKGQRTPNRLGLLRDWVLKGGSLVMVGGYYSFQGIYGGARYHGTAIEEVLPINISPYDDRLEIPEGFFPEIIDEYHPILKDIPGEFPFLLGLNKVEPKKTARVLVAGTSDSPLLIVNDVGAGRTVAWTTDIGPHWCPREFQEWKYFGKLWVNILNWCTHSL